MARTTQEIKKTMTDHFISDSEIRRLYGLSSGDTFDRRFSSVSIESILFFIVAAACHTMERIFEAFRDEVRTHIDRSVVATIPWYHQQALAYQHGDELVLDESTMRYRYPRADKSKQVIKYAAIVDRGAAINILVSGEKDGRPEPLSDTILTAFKSYIHRIKIAGVVVSVRSLPADHIEIEASIEVDPMLISGSGVRYSDGIRPVEEAVRSYLAGITYGGKFNKTKLVDAIQAVSGVRDITLGSVRVRPHNASEYRTLTGNNYSALSGCFELQNIQSTLSYVV